MRGRGEKKRNRNAGDEENGEWGERGAVMERCFDKWDPGVNS